MKRNKMLIVSVACGVCAFILSFIYLHFKTVQLSGGYGAREVLVATADIKPYTLMEPGLVEFKKVARANTQPGVLKDPAQLAGMVTIAPIKKGEQILETKLIVGGQKSGLSLKIPDGKRAVSTFVDGEDGVGGLIRPDDYVDVIITFDYGNSGFSEKYTYTLFQNAEVLAVDSDIYSLRNPEGVAVIEKKDGGMFGGMPFIKGLKASSSVITLALDPDDAQKFVFAREAGKISLVLRPPLDKTLYKQFDPVVMGKLTGRDDFVKKGFKEYRGR